MGQKNLGPLYTGGFQVDGHNFLHLVYLLPLTELER